MRNVHTYLYDQYFMFTAKTQDPEKSQRIFLIIERSYNL